ncbi:MAG: hypothetical protein J2P37_02380 [Ktedonobacteraceae bacterium]|nr:hypothetical protein [Ktedonobacteraceae bacterium]MBO0790432.1 hypothetical protein [Ktedonobacteraceae bacterium]
MMMSVLHQPGENNQTSRFRLVLVAQGMATLPGNSCKDTCQTPVPPNTCKLECSTDAPFMDWVEEVPTPVVR